MATNVYEYKIRFSGDSKPLEAELKKVNGLLKQTEDGYVIDLTELFKLDYDSIQKQLNKIEKFLPKDLYTQIHYQVNEREFNRLSKIADRARMEADWGLEPNIQIADNWESYFGNLGDDAQQALLKSIGDDLGVELDADLAKQADSISDYFEEFGSDVQERIIEGIERSSALNKQAIAWGDYFDKLGAQVMEGITSGVGGQEWADAYYAFVDQYGRLSQEIKDEIARINSDLFNSLERTQRLTTEKKTLELLKYGNKKGQTYKTPYNKTATYDEAHFRQEASKYLDKMNQSSSKPSDYEYEIDPDKLIKTPARNKASKKAKEIAEETKEAVEQEIKEITDAISDATEGGESGNAPEIQIKVTVDASTVKSQIEDGLKESGDIEIPAKVNTEKLVDALRSELEEQEPIKIPVIGDTEKLKESISSAETSNGETLLDVINKLANNNASSGITELAKSVKGLVDALSLIHSDELMSLDDLFESIQEQARGLSKVQKFETEANAKAADSIFQRFVEYRMRGGTNKIKDIGASKYLTNYLDALNNGEAQTSLSREATGFGDVGTAAWKAAQGKEAFRVENENIVSQIPKSLEALSGENGAFESFVSLIGRLNNYDPDQIGKTADALGQIASIKNDLTEAINTLNTPVNSNSFINSLERLANSGTDFQSLAAVISATKRQIDNATKSITGTTIASGQLTRGDKKGFQGIFNQFERDKNLSKYISSNQERSRMLIELEDAFYSYDGSKPGARDAFRDKLDAMKAEIKDAKAEIKNEAKQIEDAMNFVSKKTNVKRYTELLGMDPKSLTAAQRDFMAEFERNYTSIPKLIQKYKNKIGDLPDGFDSKLKGVSVAMANAMTDVAKSAGDIGSLITQDLADSLDPTAFKTLRDSAELAAQDVQSVLDKIAKHSPDSQWSLKNVQNLISQLTNAKNIVDEIRSTEILPKSEYESFISGISGDPKLMSRLLGNESTRIMLTDLAESFYNFDGTKSGAVDAFKAQMDAVADVVRQTKDEIAQEEKEIRTSLTDALNFVGKKENIKKFTELLGLDPKSLSADHINCGSGS